MFALSCSWKCVHRIQKPPQQPAEFNAVTNTVTWQDEGGGGGEGGGVDGGSACAVAAGRATLMTAAAEAPVEV